MGQGLAGSCLALQLIKEKKEIVVYDEPQKKLASAVAAGLFNPITGKLLKLSWLAEEIFPILFQFYKEAEDLLKRRFFHPFPIYRPFISVEEQNEWMALSELDPFKKFISRIHTSAAFGGQVNDPLGGLVTDFSGYLDTVSFMEATRDFLEEKGFYHRAFFDPKGLVIQNERVSYEGIEARKIVFCDGLGIKNNSLFDWIPLNSLKGETLQVSLKEEPTVIFNRGVYVVPSRDGKTFIVGATYNNRDASEDVSVGARKELEDKLTSLIKIPFNVNHQMWGMRPTSPDRKPIIGPHPKFKNLIVFNGLGTKGVSLAPYFSGILSAWLREAGEIPYEVNIERFKSLYSKFSSVII